MKELAHYVIAHFSKKAIPAALIKADSRDPQQSMTSKPLGRSYGDFGIAAIHGHRNSDTDLFCTDGPCSRGPAERNGQELVSRIRADTELHALQRSLATLLELHRSPSCKSCSCNSSCMSGNKHLWSSSSILHR